MIGYILHAALSGILNLDGTIRVEYLNSKSWAGHKGIKVQEVSLASQKREVFWAWWPALVISAIRRLRQAYPEI